MSLQAIGPAKLEVLAIEYPGKVNDSIRLFCEQVNDAHQKELDSMKEIERQLQNSLLKEKEDSLKSHRQHEQQVCPYLTITCLACLPYYHLLSLAITCLPYFHLLSLTITYHH